MAVLPRIESRCGESLFMDLAIAMKSPAK